MGMVQFFGAKQVPMDVDGDVSCHAPHLGYIVGAPISGRGMYVTKQKGPPSIPICLTLGLA